MHHRLSSAINARPVIRRAGLCRSAACHAGLVRNARLANWTAYARDPSLLAERSYDVPALFTTRNTHLLHSISNCENLFLFHVAPPRYGCVFPIVSRVSLTNSHLARRGRNERTELLPRANRGNGMADEAPGGFPPKPGSTTRFTGCPVSRSIARIDNSSAGATIVIACP